MKSHPNLFALLPGSLGLRQNDGMKILEKIVGWGRKNKSVQVLVLTGSRARGDADELSDYDVVVFSKDPRPCIPPIGKVWVCLPEIAVREGKVFPTRLVIYENGINVDFTFLPIEMIQKYCDP